MLNAKIQDALNKQLNAELFSSYLYLSMAAYFESKTLPGMAGWMRVQAQEELMHALKFYGFINQRNGRVALTSVDAPQTEWANPLAVFEQSQQHEKKVTGLINSLVELAAAEKDHATEAFLQWFVNEQVEEEASVLTIVDRLKMVGDSPVAYFMLDSVLGQRTAPGPSAAAT